jgi:hypothetical protein
MYNLRNKGGNDYSTTAKYGEAGTGNPTAILYRTLEINDK